MPDLLDQPTHISADAARGGRIVLTTPLRRMLFLAGLGGLLLLGLALMFAAYR